jgi:hypothetical protein
MDGSVLIAVKLYSKKINPSSLILLVFFINNKNAGTDINPWTSLARDFGGQASSQAFSPELNPGIRTNGLIWLSI